MDAKISCVHNRFMAKKVFPKRKQFRKTYIREWRLDRGYTLEKLADRIGIKASALSYLERGQSAYTQGTLEALAAALQTDPASLIMRNPNDADAIWSLWDEASEGEKRQISEVVKALRRAG
jgi:transcriptional regulator with XRE-family HTH domain